MTKLIVQIPCYNEESALPVTLSALPRSVPGVDIVEWLIIDDGSEDGTSRVAKASGADHVVRLPRHQGLARAFIAGLDASLRLGADIIVNTDADNQYCAEDIPELVAPVLAGEAEIVVGARPINEIKHFSLVKKSLQRLGSWATRVVSQTNIEDAPSGFRAISREAAMKLHVFNEYTYTIETIIQAGQKGMAIKSVPIRTNTQVRPSRLVGSLAGYMGRQLLTMVRIFMTYKPFRFFTVLGGSAFLAGFLIGLRFLYFYMTGGGSGHIQSLILAALLMGIGVFLGVVGLVADLISVNRKLLEDLDWRLRTLEDTQLRGDRRDK
ncbi:MAG: glycosyltransferase family 2 protein [Gemmatimonadales bacterium]|jgi:glycosyltransferase involved in cell wall biosynthesis